VSTPATAVPVIVAAAVAAGHDGRAEAVLDVRYPNGAVRSVTVTEDALADAVRVAGVDRLEDLCGQPWTVLLAELHTDDHTGINTGSDTGIHTGNHTGIHTDSDTQSDEERPCST
jgi:hypothetical protein